MARSSFRKAGHGGRRGFLLAALGASAALSFGSIGAATARATGARVHVPLRDQPPLAHTGGFGEQTCLTCHMDGELNEPGGTLVIEGLPSRYRAGARYALTIALQHPELRAAGFELSVRFATGADSARQAGTLAVDGEGAAVSLEPSNRVQYAHHLRPGTLVAAPGSARWAVTWTAPATGSAPVVFHVAANAANDNDSPMGDYIYARGFSVPLREK